MPHEPKTANNSSIALVKSVSQVSKMSPIFVAMQTTDTMH